MVLRSVCVAVIALMLAGCQGWAAESRLIPVAERDPIGLSGTYRVEGKRVTIAEDADGVVVAKRKGRKQPPLALAFDLLRVEAPEVEIEGDIRPRAYLMEMPFENEDGTVLYLYEIVLLDSSDDGSSTYLKQFKVVCSKAAEALAVRKDYELCIFDDYVRLRTAALDALAWHDDARMAVETETVVLEKVTKAAKR